MSSPEKNAKNRLEVIANQTEGFLKKVSGSAEHLTQQKSSTLYGVIGAIAGTLLGVGLDQIYPVIGIVDDIVVSGALTALGAAVGVRVYRGKRIVKIEKHIEEYTLLHDDIINKLNQLPDDAPNSIRAEYYTKLRKLNNHYSNEDSLLKLTINSGPNTLPNPESDLEENSIIEHEKNE